jgi:Na+-transporting NADH:ubiquinone oxidoreductase subunit NqrC
MKSYNLIEQLLLLGLFISLICSIIICYQVYVMKDISYKTRFSTWQMPMIFAIFADLYFLQE